jgi:hypothetical protein
LRSGRFCRYNTYNNDNNDNSDNIDNDDNISTSTTRQPGVCEANAFSSGEAAAYNTDNGQPAPYSL